MNLFIILFILVANIVACLLTFHSFGKEMENSKKIKSTLMIIGAMYILTLILYFISGLGVEKVKNGEVYRNYLMMAFVPVNLIIIIPYSINSIMKAKKGNLDKQILNKRLVTIEMIAVFIFVAEFLYFRGSQKNMQRLAEEANNMANSQSIVSENLVENTDANVENQGNTNNEISNGEKYLNNVTN